MKSVIPYPSEQSHTSIVVIVIIIVIIVITEQAQTCFLADDDNDCLGVVCEHAIFLQSGNRILDLFHQPAFATTQPTDAGARMLAEVDHADDTLPGGIGGWDGWCSFGRSHSCLLKNLAKK
jgi:hypothetical protein